MLHEKPNESFHWKNKLDELDYLPDEPLRDKAASWEKLHNRLRKKPVSRKAIWYWLAAACVLIIAGVLLIIPNQDHDQIAEKENLSIPEQPKNKSVTAKEEKALIISEKPIPGAIKKPTVIASAKKKDHSVLKITMIKGNAAEDSVATKQSLPEVIVHSNQAQDTLNTKAVTTAAAPKKLRVVHINEIVKPSEEMPLARVTLQASLQRKLSYQNNFPALTLSKNASDNLVKIKLAPSN
jgi:hypothetical protein